MLNIFVTDLRLKTMAEELKITGNAPRAAIYQELVPQIRALVEGEPDLTANLANISAALKEAFGFLWVGFYLEKDGELVLGPFQGPVACTRIKFDEGVCGHSFSTRETVIVPDVDQFPGHIACSSASRSEIVVPLIDNRNVVFGVLDVDSESLGDFSEVDKKGLEEIAGLIKV
jgi:GAF domain-containing protein